MSPEKEPISLEEVEGQSEQSTENTEEQLQSTAAMLKEYNKRVQRLASSQESVEQRKAMLKMAEHATGKPIKIGAAAQNQAQAGQAEFGLEVNQDESRLRDLVGTIPGARLQPREKGAGFDLYYEDQATHEERLIEA